MEDGVRRSFGVTLLAGWIGAGCAWRVDAPTHGADRSASSEAATPRGDAWSTDLSWRAKIEPTPVTEKMARPIIITRRTPAGGGARLPCLGRDAGFFRNTPDFVLEIDRPVADLVVELRAAAPASVRVFGPLPPAGASAAPCSMLASLGSRLEPGIYAVRVAPRTNDGRLFHHLVVRSKTTPRDPRTLPEAFEEAVPMTGRFIERHFPQLLVRDLLEPETGGDPTDELRAWVLEHAPKTLFVFAKRDLGDSDASLHQATPRTRGSWHSRSPRPELPRKNEPLLLLQVVDPAPRRIVMAADGSIFTVHANDLAADPSGPIALPARARNPQMSFTRAVDGRAAGDARVYEAYEAQARAHERCAGPIQARADAQTEAIERKPRYEQSAREIDRIQEDAARSIERSCGDEALTRKRDEAWLALMESRRTRRDALLSRVRTHLDEIF